jgi:uncharacterized membrane protein
MVAFPNHPAPANEQTRVSSRSPVHGHPSELAQVVERNIQALLQRKQKQDRAKRLPERIADAVTKFAGSMTFVFIHLVAYGLWIVVNLGLVPGIEPFDPTFVVLAMEASVEAIFLSTFVLISQNRMAAAADERADLDLQVSLLSEHEVTRLVSLVAQIAQKMGIEDAHDPELHELARDVAPEKVMDRMEAHERALGVERAG